MDKVMIAQSLDDLPKIAQWILNETQDKKVVIFNASMGAGKTTLISIMCQQLGVVDQVTSPTFAVINEYVRSDAPSVYHFDCYRLKNKGEAYDIGFEDYFYSGNYCFVEWPDIVEDLLPQNTLQVSIEVQDDGSRCFAIE